MRNSLQASVISIILFVSPLSAAAEEIILFKCYFDWSCDPNRKCTEADLDRRIKHFTETNEVELLGGDPLSKMAVQIGDRSVSFLEMQISGAVDVTTIKITNGEAVHSTHKINGMTLSPQQYLGECVALPSSE